MRRRDPGGFGRRLRAVALAAKDLADSLLGRRPALVPPRRLVEGVGGFDFREVGEHLAGIVREQGELRPHERLLDIGCGVGRLAVPMTGFLTTGEYLGFDLSAAAIRWCRRAISGAHPSFHFAHADIANSHYNPGGTTPAERFRFPCADASVDVAFAASVFTHLTPFAADRYLEESARALKPGGRLLASFFLLDESLRPGLGRFWPRFESFPEPYFAVADPRDPEAAIAFDRAVVLAALARHGFGEIRVLPGSWAHRQGALSFQDFVFARRLPD